MHMCLLLVDYHKKILDLVTTTTNDQMIEFRLEMEKIGYSFDLV